MAQPLTPPLKPPYIVQHMEKMANICVKFLKLPKDIQGDFMPRRYIGSGANVWLFDETISAFEGTDYTVFSFDGTDYVIGKRKTRESFKLAWVIEKKGIPLNDLGLATPKEVEYFENFSASLDGDSGIPVDHPLFATILRDFEDVQTMEARVRKALNALSTLDESSQIEAAWFGQKSPRAKEPDSTSIERLEKTQACIAFLDHLNAHWVAAPSPKATRRLSRLEQFAAEAKKNNQARASTSAPTDTLKKDNHDHFTRQPRRP